MMRSWALLPEQSSASQKVFSRSGSKDLEIGLIRKLLSFIMGLIRVNSRPNKLLDKE